MRVLIADDHALVRESVALLLKSDGETDVAEAEDMEQATLAMTEQGPFDLVLIDYSMPGVGGVIGLKRILERFPDVKIALFSGTANRSVVVDALQIGAAGFVPKTLSADSMVHAVKLMASGERYLPISFLTATASDSGEGIVGIGANLTERELQALRGLCNGLSNKEIAQNYGVQEVTVKLHVKTLCRKLSARNRTHAAMIAKEHGLA